MSIKLTSPILYAGAHVPVDGATLSYAADLEADLVNRNMAVYVSNPAQGGLEPVMSSRNPLTGGNRLSSPRNINNRDFNYDWLIPVHWPVMMPERFTTGFPITVISLSANLDTSSNADVGRRPVTDQALRLTHTGDAVSRTLHVPFPQSGQFAGTYSKVAGRVHFRLKCDNWQAVTRLYLGFSAIGGTTSNYQYFVLLDSTNQTVHGQSDPAYTAAWNGVYRTFVVTIDKHPAKVGSAPDWNAANPTFLTDGLIVTMNASAAANIWIDRIYSPEWPVGVVSAIFDGCYASVQSIALPAFEERGWRAGVSGNRIDGGTFGATTYPTLAQLATASQKHDVFAHGHDLSGATPTPFTGSTTVATAKEVLIQLRSAMEGAGVRGVGMRWHQWLQNAGTYAGTDFPAILKSLGIGASRGDTIDPEFGVNVANATYIKSWAGVACGGVPASGQPINGFIGPRGRWNRFPAEWFRGATSPATADTYAGSPMQLAVSHCAATNDALCSYNHSIFSQADLAIQAAADSGQYYNVGTRFFADLMADLDTKVAAGDLLVLSPTEVESLTYWRPGEYYVRWDGEWVYRADPTKIAF